MQETPVQSLGQEDPLDKEMANHSSTLAWEIPWTEEPGGLQSMGPKESDTTATKQQYPAKQTRGPWQSEILTKSKTLFRRGKNLSDAASLNVNIGTNNTFLHRMPADPLT